jgi:hypothetical protein
LGAESSASTTTAWFALVGALGGVLLTGAVSIATVILNQRSQMRASREALARDRAMELREDRRKAYADYWLATQRFAALIVDLSTATKAENSEEAGEPERSAARQANAQASQAALAWREAAAVAILVASPETLKTLYEHGHEMDEMHRSAFEGRWTGRNEETVHINQALLGQMRSDVLWKRPNSSYSISTP